MDLRPTSEYRGWTPASKKKKKYLSLRFTSTFHLTHPNSLYGQGLRQAKTPPKANLPITKVVKEKNAFRKSLKAGTHTQVPVFTHSRFFEVGKASEKTPTAFYGILLLLMPKTLSLPQVPIF
ncbi:hypothetical protein AVEN_263743-1 [Araneus ventricosus]|uniref:Uncharacterized protein n=1 Tax=Araneus ventricosus TaxID=182803 RepID=A0A4Y2AU75_ARAVE|nr:hypothetical protein AVEN_263743-1 [Araneus ventricosus]